MSGAELVEVIGWQQPPIEILVQDNPAASIWISPRVVEVIYEWIDGIVCIELGDKRVVYTKDGLIDVVRKFRKD